MNSEKPQKYFLYVRKSTESEDRQALSIESQIAEMQNIAKRENIKIVRVFQESKSAKALGRPVFSEMLNSIMKREASGILCWKLDRLARNFVDGGAIIQMLQSNDIKHIRTYDKSYYPQDNVLLMSVEFGMANQYSRDLAVNVKRGLRAKAQMGWYPVQPPLGYLNTKTTDKGKNTIYDDPERFVVVRKMWDLMLTGAYTAPKIHEIATKEWGLRTRRNMKMSVSNIYALFYNTFYYGSYEWPRGSGEWYTGKHNPMITQEEFDMVQRILGKKGRPRPKTHTFAFTGIMRCGECGCSITAEDKRKVQQNGNVHTYVYYHCTKKSDKPCAQGSIEEKELKKQVDAELATLEIPETFHTWAMGWIQKEIDKDSTSRVSITESQRREYDAIVNKIERLIDMRAGGEITDEELRNKKAEAMKEKERLAALLNDGDKRFTSWADNMESALAFVAKARDKFNTGTDIERRRIFMALGSNLLIKDKKVIFDETNSLLPMKKVSATIKRIHTRSEPPKEANKQTIQRHFDRLYDRDSILSAR